MGTADEYTRKHMADEGVVLRDKAKSRIGFQLLSLIPLGLFALATAVLTLTPLWPLAGLTALMSLGFLFMWSTLSVVRTVVTNDELHVQVGIWGPRVPHERIRSIRVAPKPNGVRVGKRLEGGRWVSSYIVRQEEHVEIEFDDEQGTERCLRFSADNPQRVVDAVNRARGMRIADFSANDAAVTDAAAEAEALAEEEALAEAAHQEEHEEP